MDYRLIALDVDGTLLDSSHVLRPRVVEAVRAAQARGFTITLATGKLLASVRAILRRLDIQGPVITLNGAATLDAISGATLRFAPLQEDDRQAVIRAVRALDPGVLVSHFTVDGILMDHDHPHMGIFADYGEGPPRLIPDLLERTLPPAAKILLSGAPERLAALRVAVTPLLQERVSITTTTPDFLEFFDPTAGKGIALRALRESRGIPREAVVAIGDGENDIPLFAEAGLAVAMANANEATRAVAHRIAPSNDENGVAVVLDEFTAGRS